MAWIWSAGDGVETHHRLLDRNTYRPLGSTAHHQGRIARDRRDGRLLGAQLLGPFPQEVSKRLDVLATALFHGMTMETLSIPWDLLKMAAQLWCRTVRTVATGNEGE